MSESAAPLTDASFPLAPPNAEIGHPLSCYTISSSTFRGDILDSMNMQSGSRPRGPKWSYDETLAAFGLYMMLDQRQRNDKNSPHIAQLAVGLNRTAGSVYMKLMNLRAHDPNERARGVSGLAHSGKLEIQIWQEYQEQSDKLLILALKGYVNFIEKVPLPTQNSRTRQTMHSSSTLQKSLVEETTSLLIDASRPLTVSGQQQTTMAPLGSEHETTALSRVNQSYFRNALVANYHDTCCLTGINIDPLLIVSHIKPWKASTGFEKTNAANGLLLNAFHDKAFDRGYMTIDDDYRVHISARVPHTDINDYWLYQFEGRYITLPSSNLPSHEFIEYHQKHVFLTV